MGNQSTKKKKKGKKKKKTSQAERVLKDTTDEGQQVKINTRRHESLVPLPTGIERLLNDPLSSLL